MTAVAGRVVVLDDVDWRMYSRLLRVFAERPRIRLAYDQGRLEIMAPLFGHDDAVDFVGDLVKVLAKAFGLPLKRGGSVTLRQRRAASNRIAVSGSPVHPGWPASAGWTCAGIRRRTWRSKST